MSLKATRPTRCIYPHQLKTLGDHLRKRRLALGLLQDEAAQKIGVTGGSLRFWELNASQPKIEHMPAVIEFLGYNPFPSDDSISGRLISFRRSNGISRQVFARFIGVDDYTLARWEQGKLTRKKYLKQRLESLLKTLENEDEKAAVLEQIIGGNGKAEQGSLANCLPPKTLGEHILARRIKLGLSQKALASLLGVSKSRIYAWENDICLPGHMKMPAVVQFLG